ncbi:MAG TPA: competence type IV pilus minor pilin ComGD [Cerasibacillus sp.]|uniref:competence type IV pilus minor pilin ComGD n=1 Tax=Cerasibacillus sp. TaxID=2498711 RepID=UPI002F41DC79
MTYQRGFTLIEMLITLSILSVLLVLTIPITHSLIKNQEETQFLETLQSDLLYVQNLSLGIREHRTKLVFHKTYYSVHKSLTESPITRELPDGWEVERSMYHTIYFLNGTIGSAGTIRINKANGKVIRLIFPLGKGRGYFVQE